MRLNVRERTIRASESGLRPFALGALVAIQLMCAAGSDSRGQVTGLYYQEVAKDGRIYLFNTSERYTAWVRSGEMGTAITLPGRGANGETLVAENETAIDLYLFKHGLPAYDRPAPKPPLPPAPSAPMTLKVGDGELKFGVLMQTWYVTDDSLPGVLTGSSGNWLGNTVGSNTFRFRRAEFKLSGNIAPEWGFSLMADVAKTQTVSTSSAVLTDSKLLQDAAVSYLGVPHQEFAVGQKKIALTEEGMHSAADLDFSERARITRLFSDRRETGLFYNGHLGEKLVLWASVTNGTPANTNDDSNDTLFSALRLDIKPARGLVVGISGGTSAGETLTNSTGTQIAQRKARDRLAGHIRYDGPETMPIGLRFEYLAATDGQLSGPDKARRGYYASALYTLAKQFQLGARYERLDQDIHLTGDTIEQWTYGFHWLPKGKNLNFKLDYYDIDEPGRTIDGAPEEKYRQFVLAAQLSF